MRRNEMDGEDEIIFRDSGGGTKMFLAGLAVGAVIALLVAPQSGVETRREIKKRAEKARRRAIRAASELSETVKDRFDDAKEFVGDEFETAKHTLEVKKRQVGRAVEAGREAARETRDSLARQVAETKAAFDAGVTTARDARRSAMSASEDERLAD